MASVTVSDWMSATTPAATLLEPANLPTYEMKAEFLPLLKPHHLRVMLALRSAGPRRFRELETGLSLNPAQLDRVLGFLLDGLWVIATTLPETARGRRVLVDYRLSRRGEAFLDAFDAFARAARERRPLLGAEAMRELDALRAA